MTQTEQQNIDYQDWLSRFLSIYRYPFKNEIERVQATVDWLIETKPIQEELDKIWSSQVARNVYRDKCHREKKSFKRDTTNLLKFFKEKHWGNLIPSITDDKYDEIQIEKCSCGKEATVYREDKKSCARCWSNTFEDGPTGLSALRAAAKLHNLGRKQGETTSEYVNRCRQTFYRLQKEAMGKITGTRTHAGKAA